MGISKKALIEIIDFDLKMNLKKKNLLRGQFSMPKC